MRFGCHARHRSSPGCGSGSWLRRVVSSADRTERPYASPSRMSLSRCCATGSFHALAFERELARAGIEVYYAIAAGDQTSPEGRLMRHMFQALDQFEVEKRAVKSDAGRPRTRSRATATADAHPTATGCAARRTPTRVVPARGIRSPVLNRIPIRRPSPLKSSSAISPEADSRRSPIT